MLPILYRPFRATDSSSPYNCKPQCCGCLINIIFIRLFTHYIAFVSFFLDRIRVLAFSLIYYLTDSFIALYIITLIIPFIKMIYV